MKIKRDFFLLFLVFFYTNQFSYAQADTVLIAHLESIWQIALSNNSNLKILALQEVQAFKDVQTVKGQQLPQVAVNFTGQDNLKLSTTPVPGDLIGQPGKTVYLQFGKAYTYSTGVSITQPVFDWQLKTQTLLATENSKMIAAQTAAFTQNLKTDIAKNYYAVLIAQASLVIAKKDKVLADSILATANNRFQQGLTDIGAVNLAAINVNNVTQNQLQTERLLNHSMATLHLLTGLPPKKVLVFNETIHTDNIKTPIIALPGKDKNLLPFQQSIHIAESQLQVKKSALLPKLYINGFTGGQQFRDDFGIDFGKNTWNGYRYLGINLNWSIFSGNSKKAAIFSAKIQQKIAEEQYHRAIEQSEINDENILLDEIQAFKMTENAKKTFLLYAKNLELAFQKYDVGLISTDIYCKQFEDYLRNENSYLNQLSELYMIEATIMARK